MTAVDDLPYFAGRPGAVFFPPALSGEIEMLNTSLLMLNFSPLPDDYAAFLSRSDGLFYDGIELYGCSSHYRESKTISFRICWKLTEIMQPITFSKTNWSSVAVPKA